MKRKTLAFAFMLVMVWQNCGPTSPETNARITAKSQVDISGDKRQELA
jgi:hypothetical protein